ncbi:NMDA receptor-regulated protein [Ceratobasidium sp. AG-Ba]|nr:NMDA receptor-regulated protein [Ceratobasidium sp. AG-Ba]QRW10679.1 NMDA receptor-regulated protein [Ceratobasidium sp. AG-Ba]
MPPPSTSKPLPAKPVQLASKEQTLFKELLSLYETRQYKKAIKTADTILKKAPTHGETMCMKGLVFTNMPGKREEGVELVRKGLALGLESHICWHVYGLVLKSDKNYTQALGAYARALKYDVDNLNILRDAAQLQMQLRLYDQLVQTRHTLLELRPTMRQSWVALAVAYQISGDLENADKVLNNYKAMLKNIPDYDLEHSELLLYHLRVKEGLGKHDEALAALDVYSKQRQILDRTSIVEYRARNLSKANRKPEAAHEWTTLIEQNYECYAYYKGLLATQDINLDDLTPETRPNALSALKNIISQYPTAIAPKRLLLDVAQGEEFKPLVEPYLWNGLKRGIPSLFVDIKALYKDDEKRRVVEEIMEGFSSKLRAEENHDEPKPTTNGTHGDSTPEPPTTYLWALYYLGQHYSYCGDQPKALSIIDTAIEHTPTLPELYLARGRALKRAGDFVGAFAAVEAARLLDGQDRWLNGKSAKYAMRAGRMEDAQALLGLFTRKDAVTPAADLQEMQSLVFLIQEGDAWRRAGKLPMALKRFNSVAQIFDDIWDDQFDFHSYCIRRYTLSTYSDAIDWEDRLKGHPAYRKAAVEATKIYIRLHDDPGLVAACTPKLSAEEKKAKAKATKAASKEPKKPAPHAKDEEIQPLKDDDPDGLKAFGQPKPLDQALKLLRPLEALEVKDIDVWLAVYDVAMRRKKYLQALKALNIVKSISPDNHELHWRVVDFRLQTSSESVASSLDASVKSALETSLPNLIPLQQSPEAFNTEYLQRQTNPRTKIAGALAILRIHGQDAGRAEAEEIIFQILHPEAKASVEDCLEGLRILRDVIKSERADEFRTSSASLLPLSTAMRTPQELEALRTELAGATQKEEEAKPLQVAAEE